MPLTISESRSSQPYNSKYEIYLNSRRINWSTFQYGAGLNFFYAVNREFYAILISINLKYPYKPRHSLGCRMDFWKISYNNYHINVFNLFFFYQFTPDFLKQAYLEAALGYGRKEMRNRYFEDIYDVNISIGTIGHFQKLAHPEQTLCECWFPASYVHNRIFRSTFSSEF